MSVPVQLAALRWESQLAGRTRRIAEAWGALGVEHRFVERPSAKGALLELALRPSRPFGAREQTLDPCVLRPAPPSLLPWWSLGERARARCARRGARRLRAELERSIDMDRAVALVVTPSWVPWLDELPFRHIVYDCIDELSVHVPRPWLAERFERWEEELLARASGAIVTAEALASSIRARHPHLPRVLVRNGVDDEWFQRRAREDGRPADLPITGRPVVGFVGALYQWIDWELVEAVAAALPELDFVLVGPRGARAPLERLTRRPNVRWLGPRDYGAVPACIAAFDLCWVPFRVDAVGLAANPVKTYEYLALGKPVVSTRVADMAHYEGLVAEARTPEQLVERIRAGLSEPPERADERRAFAARNSWRVRARELLDFLASLDAPAVVAPAGGPYRPRP